MSKIDHEYTDEMVCPHCGATQSDVGEFVGDDEDGETECDECGKKFYWSQHISISYSTKRLVTVTCLECGESFESPEPDTENAWGRCPTCGVYGKASMDGTKAWA